jgi:hypothetical protein
MTKTQIHAKQEPQEGVDVLMGKEIRQECETQIRSENANSQAPSIRCKVSLSSTERC